MPVSARDTIVALSSGPPPAALALIRMSGPAARAICEQMLTCGVPSPRTATYSGLKDQSGALVDRGLVVFLPGPATFTGEDTLELTLHGGAAIIEHALAALTSYPDVRLAEPGEFTRRAFESGKLDLAQAEGIADLIESETRGQKAQALRQVDGGLSHTYNEWRISLTELLALIEVTVDFPDEADAPTNTDGPVARRLDALIAQIENALGDGGIGEKIRDGFRVAIIGAPNAGKSTLLNRIAGRDAAIVTPLPGTTRDVIDVRKVLGGQVVWFSDTAGLRETEDRIEAEGIARAKRAAAAADLRLFVIDATAPDFSVLEPSLLEPQDFILLNKSDVAKASLPALQNVSRETSAATGAGLASLENEIALFFSKRAAQIEAPVITRARHRERLSAGLGFLMVARDGLKAGAGPEFVAEDVRQALRQLGSILGTVSTEDVLSAVFSKFCIGK